MLPLITITIKGCATYACPGPGGKNGKQQQKQQQEPQQQGEGGEGEAAAELFLDFNPLKLRQSEGQRQLEFETFDGALEEFFSKVSDL